MGFRVLRSRVSCHFFHQNPTCWLQIAGTAIPCGPPRASKPLGNTAAFGPGWCRHGLIFSTKSIQQRDWDGPNSLGWIWNMEKHGKKTWKTQQKKTWEKNGAKRNESFERWNRLDSTHGDSVAFLKRGVDWGSTGLESGPKVWILLIQPHGWEHQYNYGFLWKVPGILNQFFRMENYISTLPSWIVHPHFLEI